MNSGRATSVSASKMNARLGFAEKLTGDHRYLRAMVSILPFEAESFPPNMRGDIPCPIYLELLRAAQMRQRWARGVKWTEGDRMSGKTDN